MATGRHLCGSQRYLRLLLGDVLELGNERTYRRRDFRTVRDPPRSEPVDGLGQAMNSILAAVSNTKG